VATNAEPYAACLDIDYSDHLDRLTTLLRLLWIIPIAIIYSALTATGTETVVTQAGQQVRTSSGGISSGIFVATTRQTSIPSSRCGAASSRKACQPVLRHNR
jgi:hypothetical protein